MVEEDKYYISPIKRNMAEIRTGAMKVDTYINMQ